MEHLSTHKPNPNQELQSAYEGFVLGNIFKDLYQPYKGMTNYKVKPHNEKQALMQKIQMYDFIKLELSLYLDNYPKDKEKTMLFEKIVKELQQTIKEYEAKYEPIKINDAVVNNKWEWSTTSWPWEKTHERIED